MASWWQFLFRTLFRASTTLNWAILSPLPPSFPTIPQQCHEVFLKQNFVTLLWNCWKRGRELSTSCRTSLFNKMSFNLPSARKIILNTISMATKMESFDLDFLRFQHKGNRVSDFWTGIPSQKSETMNHLKTLMMVSMETKVLSGDSFLDQLSEKLYLNGFWEG